MTSTSVCLLSKNLSFTPYDVNWVPKSSRVCIVGATNQGTGRIAAYGLEGKQLELKQETETSSAIRCGTMTGQSRNFVTGDFDGQMQIWDTQRFDIPLFSVKAHETIINSMSSSKDTSGPQEWVTGSRDGTVKIWDRRQPEKEVITFKSESSQDIWAVSYGLLKGNAIAAVGYDNGDVKLFNLENCTYLWHTNVETGVCSLDMMDDTLSVSTLEGAYVIDLNTGSKTQLVSNNKKVTLWSIRHIPGKSDYFAVAGGDGTVSVWNQKKLDAPSSKLNLSKHPVTSLDWNQDKKGLFACTSFDQTIKLGMVNGV